MTLRAGVGAGAVLDATATHRSYAELALPLSVTFAGAVELVDRPSVAVPLSHEAAPVFGGSRELSASPGVAPIDLHLRVRAPVF